jgi:hypothetical protein
MRETVRNSAAFVCDRQERKVTSRALNEGLSTVGVTRTLYSLWGSVLYPVWRNCPRIETPQKWVLEAGTTVPQKYEPQMSPLEADTWSVNWLLEKNVALMPRNWAGGLRGRWSVATGWTVCRQWNWSIQRSGRYEALLFIYGTARHGSDCSLLQSFRRW